MLSHIGKAITIIIVLILFLPFCLSSMIEKVLIWNWDSC